MLLETPSNPSPATVNESPGPIPRLQRPTYRKNGRQSSTSPGIPPSANASRNMLCGWNPHVPTLAKPDSPSPPSGFCSPARRPSTNSTSRCVKYCSARSRMMNRSLNTPTARSPNRVATATIAYDADREERQKHAPIHPVHAQVDDHAEEQRQHRTARTRQQHEQRRQWRGDQTHDPQPPAARRRSNGATPAPAAPCSARTRSDRPTAPPAARPSAIVTTAVARLPSARPTPTRQHEQAPPESVDGRSYAADPERYHRQNA